MPDGDNFTIRWKQRFDGLSGAFSGVLSTKNTAIALRYYGNAMTLNLSSNGSTWDIAPNVQIQKTDFQNDQWYDMEFSYSNATGYKLYIDGELNVEINDTTKLFDANRLIFGSRHDGNYKTQGAISDVFITNSQVLHSQNFTPSSQPFSLNDNEGALSGTSGADVLSGSEIADELIGGAGNDVLYGRANDDLLLGGEGDDTYVWNLGDGSDTIEDESGINTLSFGNELSLDNVYFARVHENGALSDDLEVRVINTGDVIRLKNWYADADRPI